MVALHVAAATFSDMALAFVDGDPAENPESLLESADPELPFATLTPSPLQGTLKDRLMLRSPKVENGALPFCFTVALHGLTNKTR